MTIPAQGNLFDQVHIRGALERFIQTDPWLDGEAFSIEGVASAIDSSVVDAERLLEQLKRDGVLEDDVSKSGQYRFWRLSAARVRELGIERE